MATVNQAYCPFFFDSRIVEALAGALHLQAATLQTWAAAAAWQLAFVEASNDGVVGVMGR